MVAGTIVLFAFLFGLVYFDSVSGLMFVVAVCCLGFVFCGL